MRDKRVSVSVRLLPEVRYQLQVMAKLLKTSQAAILESLVTALYQESIHDWSGAALSDALLTAKRRADGKRGSSRLILVAHESPLKSWKNPHAKDLESLIRGQGR